MTPVRLEPAALRSRVKHSTTEPLRSLIMDNVCLNLSCLCGAQKLNRRFASSRLTDVRVTEQDTETAIKQKDKKSSRSDWDEKYQSKQTFYRLLSTGSTQVDPSQQDRKIVDSDVKNQAKQIKTSKRTNQMLLLCPVRLNSH